MTWALVGSMAMQVGGSIIGGNKANKQALEGAKFEAKKEEAAWDQNAAQNKAIAATNLQNVIRTGYKVGLLNVQRAQAKKNAMQQGIDLSRSALQASSAAAANAAASGSIGSSVDAVMSDIQMRVDEAGAQMGYDYQQQEDNFDVMLHDLITSGQDAQASDTKANIISAPAPVLSSFTEMVLGGAANTAGQYFSAKIAADAGGGKK